MARRRRGTTTTSLSPYVGVSSPGTTMLPGSIPSGAGLTPQNPTYQGGQNPYEAAAPPINPALEAYRVSANRNAALGAAYAGYQGAQLENEYGLGSDLSNPYSRAKLLEETYRRNQRGTTNSYAAQGQLYSGAYGRMQGENERNYNIGFDQLSRAYTGAKTNLAFGQLQGYANNALGIDDATFNALLKALGGK